MIGDLYVVKDFCTVLWRGQHKVYLREGEVVIPVRYGTLTKRIKGAVVVFCSFGLFDTHKHQFLRHCEPLA